MAQTPSPSPSPTPSPISIRTVLLCHQNPHHDHDINTYNTHNLNLMIVLAAIFCAFVCALGLNSMLQCIFQCANRAITEPVQWVASRRLNSGLKKKEMVALPTSTYSSSSPSPSSSPGCAICLVDFSDGDEIRVLPKCNHRFHVVCIDKWLQSHSSCPTCRHRLKSSSDTNHTTLSLSEILTT